MIRKIITICFAACLGLSAFADTDENGIEPSMWFKFDGDATNYGSNGASITPVGTYETVSGTDQALVVSGSAQSGSGAPTKLPYTLHLRAKLVTVTDKSICGFGGGQVGGFNFVIAGACKVGIRTHGYSAWSSYNIPATEVSGANDAYHYFTYVAETGSSKLYYDGVLLASSSDVRTAGNGLWSIGKIGGNAADAVPSGVKIADLRTYAVALTEEQIAKIVTGATAVWGTAGRLGEGVATNEDGSFEQKSWTFNFSEDENIVHDDIALTKMVRITKVRLMQRANKGNQPTTATLKQGDTTSEALSVNSYDTGMTLYGSDGTEKVTRGYHECLFDGSVEFDPTKNITIEFDNAKTGCSVMQPINPVMFATPSTVSWSPVIEITVSSSVSSYTATMTGDAKFSELVWEPARPSRGFSEDATLIINNTTAGTLEIDEEIDVASVKVVNESGNKLTLAMESSARAIRWNFSNAAGGVTVALRDAMVGVPRAVVGAPYSDWVLSGSISGTYDVTLPSVIERGYSVTNEYVSGYGLRLVVTAPETAKYGEVSLNLHNGTSLSGSGNHGLYPVDLGSWVNLKAENDAKTTYSSLSFALSSSISGFGLSGTPPDMIQKQYMDDNQNSVKRTITVSGMTARGFSNYRVLVYFSTDSENYQFAPMEVVENGASIYYAGTTATTNGSYTLKGSDAGWGHAGPAYNANALKEGVNMLATDVMTSNSFVLGFLRTGNLRATPAAIQVVKVYDAFTATMSGSANFSELTWAPFKPSVGFNTKYGNIRIENAKASTLTLDGSVSVNTFTVANYENSMLTLKYTDSSVSARTWDFSETEGKVSLDCSQLEITEGTVLMSHVVGIENIDAASCLVPARTKLVIDSTSNKVMLKVFEAEGLQIAVRGNARVGAARSYTENLTRVDDWMGDEWIALSDVSFTSYALSERLGTTKGVRYGRWESTEEVTGLGSAWVPNTTLPMCMYLITPDTNLTFVSTREGRAGGGNAVHLSFLTAPRKNLSDLSGECLGGFAVSTNASGKVSFFGWTLNGWIPLVWTGTTDLGDSDAEVWYDVVMRFRAFEDADKNIQVQYFAKKGSEGYQVLTNANDAATWFDTDVSGGDASVGALDFLGVGGLETLSTREKGGFSLRLR